MPLTKPNQELYEDFEGHAATLDWTALEVLDVAKRLSEAGLSDYAIELMEIGNALKEQHKVILGIADNVQDGLIVRSEL